MTEILTPTPREVESFTTDDTEPTGLDIIDYTEFLINAQVLEWLERRERVLAIYERFAEVHPTGYLEIYQEMLRESAEALRVPDEDHREAQTAITQYSGKVGVYKKGKRK